MYLGHREILNRIAREKILEGFEEDNVQGAGVDLRVERVYNITSGASLGAEERRLPEVEEMEGGKFTLEPEEYHLLLTREKVNLPSDLIAFIYPRSTLFRSGVSLRTAVVDPGYRGRLTIGLVNEGAGDFTLEKGASVAQIVFAGLEGTAKSYSGKYQGGKLV